MWQESKILRILYLVVKMIALVVLFGLVVLLCFSFVYVGNPLPKEQRDEVQALFAKAKRVELVKLCHTKKHDDWMIDEQAGTSELNSEAIARLSTLMSSKQIWRPFCGKGYPWQYGVVISSPNGSKDIFCFSLRFHMIELGVVREDGTVESKYYRTCDLAGSWRGTLRKLVENARGEKGDETESSSR